jgi:hypothetical protein
MGNPVYPFLFGGPFWDEFRARWYTGAGTGIGWSPLDLLALPFVTTLGYRDANYYDGRIGPLYLALLPVVLAGLWSSWRRQGRLNDAKGLLLLFSLTSILFWTFGVVQTNHLMQARLLWPGLIPLIPFVAAGITELAALDAEKFRTSFVFSTLAALMTFAFLLDFALLVAFRNPVRAAIGSESRAAYTSRIQPAYAEALDLIAQAPADAFIYMLNEQRSYGMTRRVQPDPINDNLAHDFYVYKTNPQALSAWSSLGYTHVLVAQSVFRPENEDMLVMLPDYELRLQNLLDMLVKIDESSGGNYLLYEIPRP